MLQCGVVVLVVVAVVVVFCCLLLPTVLVHSRGIVGRLMVCMLQLVVRVPQSVVVVVVGRVYPVVVAVVVVVVVGFQWVEVACPPMGGSGILVVWSLSPRVSRLSSWLLVLVWLGGAMVVVVQVLSFGLVLVS